MRSASNDELDHHLMGMEFLSESLLTVRRGKNWNNLLETMIAMAINTN